MKPVSMSMSVLLIHALAYSSINAQDMPVLEIEINASATLDDDYIGWSPVQCRIREVSDAYTQAIQARLTSSKRIAGQHNGEVHFAPYSAAAPTPATFQPQPELTVTIPGDGTWLSFFIAGKESSSNGKDVTMTVTNNGTNQMLKGHQVMVRVRKSTESSDLTDDEIKWFLEALSQLHDLDNNMANSKFMKYVVAHEEPFGDLHGNPGFTAWHRAFLLSLERELQQIDPRVALPYWEFENPAPRLFSRSFMGFVPAGSVFVEFNEDNPIFGWGTPDDGLLRRSVNRDLTGVPGIDITSPMGTADYRLMWSRLESRYHNGAHGLGGWIATAGSPRDPIFFLLHANVDRAWGLWQRTYNHFDSLGVDETSYAPLGTYPGTSVSDRAHYGHYAQDTMWPWNGQTGETTPSDPLDNWPAQPSPFAMIPPQANHGPTLPMTVVAMVDYLAVSGNGGCHGVCYDNLRFSIAP